MRWTEERFVARFKKGRTRAGSPMPWASYALMDETDLKSVYHYLMSLPPVRNDVGSVVARKD